MKPQPFLELADAIRELQATEHASEGMTAKEIATVLFGSDASWPTRKAREIIAKGIGLGRIKVEKASRTIINGQSRTETVYAICDSQHGGAKCVSRSKTCSGRKASKRKTRC